MTAPVPKHIDGGGGGARRFSLRWTAHRSRGGGGRGGGGGVLGPGRGTRRTPPGGCPGLLHPVLRRWGGGGLGLEGGYPPVPGVMCYDGCVTQPLIGGGPQGTPPAPQTPGTERDQRRPLRAVWAARRPLAVVGHWGRQETVTDCPRGA